MLTYKLIGHEKKYAREIWIIEQQGPRWFVDASAVWTPTYRSFLKFWRQNWEIWGLFDDDSERGPLAVVYLDLLSEAFDINIHVSILDRKLSVEDIVRFFSSLTLHKTEQGVRYKQAWILGRNRFLMNIARRAGYEPTGVEMTYGSARGKTLDWIQVGCD